VVLAYDRAGLPFFEKSPFFTLWLENKRVEHLSRADFAQRLLYFVRLTGATISYQAASATEPAYSETKTAVVEQRRKEVAEAPEMTAEALSLYKESVLVGADITVLQRRQVEKHWLRALLHFDGPITAKWLSEYERAPTWYANLRALYYCANDNKPLSLPEGLERLRLAEQAAYRWGELAAQNERFLGGGAASPALQLVASDLVRPDLVRPTDIRQSKYVFATAAAQLLAVCGFEDHWRREFRSTAELNSRLQTQQKKIICAFEALSPLGVPPPAWARGPVPAFIKAAAHVFKLLYGVDCRLVDSLYELVPCELFDRVIEEAVTLQPQRTRPNLYSRWEPECLAGSGSTIIVNSYDQTLNRAADPGLAQPAQETGLAADSVDLSVDCTW